MNRTGSTPPRRARCFTAAAAVALAFAGAPSAVEASDDVYACVNNASGQTQFVSADTVCPKNATLVTWNVVGATGPEGEPGVSSYQVVSAPFSTAPPFGGVFGGLLCPQGKKPLGGGVSMDVPPPGYAIVQSRPLAPGDLGLADPHGWTGLVRLTDAAQPVASVTMRLWAICAVVQ